MPPTNVSQMTFFKGEKMMVNKRAVSVAYKNEQLEAFPNPYQKQILGLKQDPGSNKVDYFQVVEKLLMAETWTRSFIVQGTTRKQPKSK